MKLNPILDGAIPFMALDPAGGKEHVKRGDDSALAVAFIKWFEREPRMFVVDVRGGRWKPDRVVDTAFIMIEKWRPRKIFVETNAFKEWLISPLKKGALERGIYLPVEDITQSKGKDRVFALTTPYSYRQVYHADELKNSKYEEQLLRFLPDGKEHDDYPDVLSTLWIHATKKRVRNSGEGIKIFKAQRPPRYSNVRERSTRRQVL